MDIWRPAFGKHRIPALIAVLCICFVLTSAALHFNYLTPLDSWCHDVYHILAGQQHDPEATLIVSIDDVSLEAFPDTPLVFWGPLYARAIRNLKNAGARSIALDIHLGVTPGQWVNTLGENPGLRMALLDYDQDFDAELSEGRVILAADTVRTPAGLDIRFPAREYLGVLPSPDDGIGLTTMFRDPDNVVRSQVPAYPREPVAPRQGPQDAQEGMQPGVWWTLGAQAARQGWGETMLTASQPFQRPRPIAYCGPPGTIPRLSFAAIAREGGLTLEETSLVNGRAVIVGVEYEGSGDRLPTPYSRGVAWVAGHRDMSNVEIHANIAETLLYPQRLTHEPFWMAGLVWLPFFAAAGGLVAHWPPWCAALGLSALAVAGWGAGMVFFHAGILFPVSGILAGMAGTAVGMAGMRLGRTERARARIRRLFGKYVSEQVLEQILQSGEDPPLGGKGYTVTVLFSDIRDFTTISERLGAEATVDLLNAYLPEACAAVQKHGGMIDKFIGDAIMAVFGMPSANADHARQAVLAALALRECADRFRAARAGQLAAKDLKPFRIGIGLHTGLAVAGNIGTPQRMEFTFIGDTVNAASRLEGLCKDLRWTIVASRETVEAAGPGVLTGGMEPAQRVKGRKEGIDVFEILGMNPPQGEGT
ncbi:adenylate/guanylate cyclase domain-containing protein [Desulfolutivibrio sulfoxidireducens]|uniref:adenylate/guanylate cyclase domain-containing protein n=1 Tax=Desulfolutivibrio sulfoxidireducens TaxID=2773299 RepID=UPI00159D3400|nr:adenylate/guanylate cyclase domain-containing protein [Desulfolutivibrio sulfoxidireducens]QLA18354.1 CHASE2 domain-containing protein [Desulfolutivibrio sulfoxidireducens]